MKNHTRILLLAAAVQISSVTAAPTASCLADPSCGPIPGLSSIYSNWTAVEAPWPGNTTGAVLNTTAGPPGEDDLLFQNLLSAEWIIFSFYQQGVEAFNESAFVSAGFPNTTYDHIREIRNNEAGHLRIFQDQISSNSVKPGPCRYQYPFNDPASFLVLLLNIEIGSMAFLTGLELQAKSTLARGALVAIASTETRHNTWALIDSFQASPFAGPSDTYYPYANQILKYTDQWVTPNSCPPENPIYPTPRPNLAALDGSADSVTPGSQLNLTVSNGSNPVVFDQQKDYFAVFFHGLLNTSVPLNMSNTTNVATIIPAELEPRGIYEVVIADEAGAPSEESVIAGPLLLLETPTSIGIETLSN